MYISAQRLVDQESSYLNDEDYQPLSGAINSLPHSNPIGSVPLDEYDNLLWRSAPRWLLSSSELKQNLPRVEFDNLSVHILNQGHGTYSFVTVHEIDNDNSALTGNKSAVENIYENAKRGVLGRIIACVRIKLLQVCTYIYIYICIHCVIICEYCLLTVLYSVSDEEGPAIRRS